MPNRDFPLAPTPKPNQNDKGKNKKLPLGASSASAESDYAKSDSLKRVVNKMSGSEWFDRISKGNSPKKLRIQSDSLRAEGDRKTRATGGVIRSNRI